MVIRTYVHVTICFTGSTVKNVKTHLNQSLSHKLAHLFNNSLTHSSIHPSIHPSILPSFLPSFLPSIYTFSLMYLPHFSECISSVALGMESLKIVDAQITASSLYNVNHAPWLARLNRRFTGKAGGWSAVSQKAGDWIQVNFYSVKTVGAIATQGRYDAYQWITSYSLSYSNNGNSFTSYQSGRVFSGNSDRHTVVKHTLNPPIIAQYIRLYVTTYHSWPSLRMEYYDC